MGRNSAIWWRESHKCWYVTFNGKQTRLHENKKEAMAIFHRMMLDRGKTDYSRETVSQLCDIYLCDAKSRLKPLTFKSYLHFLQSFCDFAGKDIARDLKPIVVTNWLASHPEWKSNSRSLAVTVVRTWSKWCKRQKCLTDDPLADVSRARITRRKPAPRGSIEKFMSHILNPNFRTFFELSLMLGTRPGELSTLRGSDIDFQAGIAIVRGKTGERRIMLPERAMEILKPLTEEWPEGPVLRNTIGKPWSGGSIESQMQSIKKRAGLKGVVLYHTRGTFATRALKNGVPSVLVSKLLGHADPTIVYKYYEQLDETDLKEAVEKANQPANPEPPPSGEPE